MVAVIDLPNAPQTFGCHPVIKLAHQGITGICRNRDYPAVVKNLGGLLEQAHLRVLWVNLKELRHLLPLSPVGTREAAIGSTWSRTALIGSV